MHVNPATKTNPTLQSANWDTTTPMALSTESSEDTDQEPLTETSTPEQLSPPRQARRPSTPEQPSPEPRYPSRVRQPPPRFAPYISHS